MTFNSLYDLRDYVQRFIDVGLGLAQPRLCRRGCECSQGEVSIGDPGDGERVSADGSKVYLTARVMEL